MSGHSTFSQIIVAAFAALLVSSVAVGAAVGPAHVIANPFAANLHA